METRNKTARLLAQVPTALASVLDIPVDSVGVSGGVDMRSELVLSAGGHSFAVEWSVSATPGLVASGATNAARRAKSLGKRVAPLVAVPFMGDTGRAVCEAAGVSWFDLSGNAHIVVPGLRVIVDGQPNRFSSPGRPASWFAPKSARVVRWLLMHPHMAFKQREIARSTGMTEGFVSRITSGLVRDNYVLRDLSGGLRVKDAALLLDAWHEQYQFAKHTIIKGHVAARSGDALARFVGDTLVALHVEHAATGLAAAWQYSHFAAFRIATFFVANAPIKELTSRLGFRENAKGANLWLVVPNDAGVLQGTEEREGIRCVHPVQAYLDLKGHPERAPEAAERLRTEYMSWKRYG
jgi:hypothetical protein